MKKLLLAAGIVVLFPASAAAQISIAVHLLGLTYHLQPQANADLYPYSVDAGGRMVAITGIQLVLDVPLYTAGRGSSAVLASLFDEHHIGLQAVVALFRDCALQPAGFLHLGARGFARRDQHGFGVSFGPAWFMRKSWESLPGYAEEGLFVSDGTTQRSFYWHGGGLEHVYYPTQQEVGISTHLIPGIPEILVLSSGMRLDTGLDTGLALP